MPYDKQFFFDSVRDSLFNGKLTQRQVDGMTYLIDTWELHFERKAGEQSTPWLAYALATAFHETAYLMVPVEEYGKGEGKEYGEPTGPYNKAYYGRGHVQLTWEQNYIRGEDILSERYKLDVPMHEYPHRMLEDEPSAIILFDGMIDGWFTGKSLEDYFDGNEEDPYHARQIVNGLDHAELIAGYYEDFKDALKLVELDEAA
jgi:putative chitinase